MKNKEEPIADEDNIQKILPRQKIKLMKVLMQILKLRFVYHL